MPALSPPNLDAFVSNERLDALIVQARAEDLGPAGVDVTSEACIAADTQAEAHVVSRAGGVVAGNALLPRIAGAYDADMTVTMNCADASEIAPGTTVTHCAGPLRSILAMERVALNLLTHLSGIATLTAHYVAQTAGTKARICDTRKTLPGLRGLAKYAVACGGGLTHRIGLYDAMLIKDNHLAGVDVDALPGVLTDAIQRCRAAHPQLKFVEVEVDTLAQLQRVLTAPGVDMVLLDNMGTAELRDAVAMRDQAAPHVELEASGGVNLETVPAIAATGVDRISVGALTHSAPALDFGLDIR